MSRLLALSCLALVACPPPMMGPPDTGSMDASVEDAGHDAGRPVRDAGFDGGWVTVAELDWCRSLATARCWRDIRCGRIDVSLTDDCIIRSQLGCDSAAYVMGSTTGRHSYDPMTAGRCLNAYDRGSCELAPAECGAVFVGLTPPDAGALVPEDCDPDSGYVYLYDYQCPHRCMPWVPEGQSCFDSSGTYIDSCKPGLHACEYADAGGDTICMTPKTEGQACISYDACATGLVCTSGKCVKQIAAVGEMCQVMNGYPYCTPEDFCRLDPAAPMAPGTCQRKPGIGGACSGLGSCLPSLHCSASLGTGTCQRLGSLGDACSSSYSYYPDCAVGLWCPTATSRCTPLPGDGGDCSFDTGSYNACANGYYCTLFPDYICQPRHADGETCSYNASCSSNECQYGPLPDAGYGFKCVRCWQMADGG